MTAQAQHMANASGDPRLEQLERRVKADPTSVAFAALAEEYRRAGRFQEAIDVCRAGLTRHPAYLSARVTLGRALIEVGALDEARRALDEVIEAAPENLAAIRALAEIHHRLGEIPEAEAHYRSAIETASRSLTVGPVEDPATHRPAEPAPAPPAAPEPASAPAVQAGAGHAYGEIDVAEIAGAQAPAAAPAPPDDPALAGLQAFLDAIVAAREALDEARPSR